MCKRRWVVRCSLPVAFIPKGPLNVNVTIQKQAVKLSLRRTEKHMASIDEENRSTFGALVG